MNKLVLLSEVRKGKNKLLEFNKIKSEEEESTKSYATFKEKFNFFQNQDSILDLNDKKNNYTKYEKRLKGIMKRIFLLDNKSLLIEFLNSIYNDELSVNTKIEYIKNKDIINKNEMKILKGSNYDVRILAEDDYRKFEYEIQFETKDDQNTAIIITKINFTNDYSNIINLNNKKREYENNNELNLEKGSKDNSNRFLIMLNSNIEVPDVYEFKTDIEGENIDNKINIMKSWKYDFKQLVEKNIYLLFPMKALDLRTRLLSIGQDAGSKDLINDEIVRFFKDMNRYLSRVKDEDIITDKDINELNLIAIDLLTHFSKEKNNICVDIKRDLEATLKYIVV
ncbi:hypothetical protein psyc5s11_07310 [Clostridium gelidum]|uniref:PD-(D/E)XK nuclease family transposase n=1 Tax=Clostridium gelidum TaxID=704125 RepID=A0ABN6IR00_9CLOT|nr:hypothetical protein [Clostridium gelidum]BCZ44664.1 hypothetical protein psyc5s11_07310 [Clostridium gelidum]